MPLEIMAFSRFSPNFSIAFTKLATQIGTTKIEAHEDNKNIIAIRE
jgi:hypothetical protein